jgi:polyhydroxyalkanoate synthesis regulator phasin
MSPEPGSALQAQKELAEKMIQQQFSLLTSTMARMEELVNQNLASLNSRVEQLKARVDHLRKRELPPS